MFNFYDQDTKIRSIRNPKSNPFKNKKNIVNNLLNTKFYYLHALIFDNTIIKKQY